jgi:hypothetical protein
MTGYDLTNTEHAPYYGCAVRDISVGVTENPGNFAQSLIAIRNSQKASLDPLRPHREVAENWKGEDSIHMRYALLLTLIISITAGNTCYKGAEKGPSIVRK